MTTAASGTVIPVAPALALTRSRYDRWSRASARSPVVLPVVCTGFMAVGAAIT